jgi:hypothetical protein
MLSKLIFSPDSSFFLHQFRRDFHNQSTQNELRIVAMSPQFSEVIRMCSVGTTQLRSQFIRSDTRRAQCQVLASSGPRQGCASTHTPARYGRCPTDEMSIEIGSAGGWPIARQDISTQVSHAFHSRLIYIILREATAMSRVTPDLRCVELHVQDRRNLQYD